MNFVVFDPGLRGAAVAFNCCLPVSAYVLEHDEDANLELKKLKTWAKKYPDHLCIVEKIGPRPLQAVGSTFKQAYVYGQLCAYVRTMFPRVEKIPPQSWTRTVKRYVENTYLSDVDSKQASALLARDLFGDFCKPWTPRTKIHDGIADCLSIGWHYMQTNQT